MLRKDLLLRQFEEFGKVLAALLLLRKEKSYDKFELEIEAATANFLETSFEFINGLDANAFQKYCAVLPPERKKMLARLLYEKMQVADELAFTDQAAEYAVKSKIAYEFYAADQTHTEFDLDAHYKLHELQKRLN